MTTDALPFVFFNIVAPMLMMWFVWTMLRAQSWVLAVKYSDIHNDAATKWMMCKTLWHEGQRTDVVTYILYVLMLIGIPIYMVQKLAFQA